MRSASYRRRALLALVAVLAAAIGAFIPGTASAAVDPEVWFGSPVGGSWNADARTHHFMTNARDYGDWATDIKVGAGVQVVLYAAPQNGGYNVTTKVEQVGPACSSGRDGASMVAVGVYANGVKVGSIKYGHVRPSVSEGQWINRWGTSIGTVATGMTPNDLCWTGPHVHLEGFNVHNYSCFNRGYGIGSWLDPSNFVGFVGGARVGGYRQPCP